MRKGASTPLKGDLIGRRGAEGATRGAVEGAESAIAWECIVGLCLVAREH
jgi:hypothetical protein